MANATTSVLKGYFNTGDKPTETNFATLIESCNNTDYTVTSSTSAIDATSIVGDHRIFLTGALAAGLTLPQATANNIGSCIRVFATVAMADDGTAMWGYANGGSTVMAGTVNVFSTGANMDAINIAADSKRIEFDASTADHAGGDEGTTGEFYSYGANLSFAKITGISTNATPALGAAAFSGTGL